MFSKLRHPVRAIREPFGTAGLIVACIALVAALGGTALAAKGALTGKQKKEVEKIAKKYAGKPGAPGAAGPQGPAGANGPQGPSGLDGENGKDGKNGTNGTNGTSVTNTEFSGPQGTCTEGGTKLEGTSTTYACNGKEGEKGEKGDEGSPWTAGGTLPSEETETGSWSFGTITAGEVPTVNPLEERLFVPLSFPIPLSAELDASHAHFLSKGAASTTECPGSAGNPQAAAGNLCVYTGNENQPGTNPSFNFLRFSFNTFIRPGEPQAGAGASTTGALLSMYILEEGAFAFGTWAVTAP